MACSSWLINSQPMPDRRAVPVSEDSEEARAFLQTRVALFWKVIFFIILLGSGLGADRGGREARAWTLLVTLASTANAGIFWWLCRRGERSIRFSRVMESGGLLLNSTIRRAARGATCWRGSRAIIRS